MPRLILFLITSFVLVLSCKKDSPDSPTATPYFLQVPPSLPPPKIPGDNPLTVEGVSLGRKLFFDPILSKDSTQSCASCHNQAWSFTDNGLAVSTGVAGIQGTRNSMPLFNLMYHPSFFWDGRATLLRHQALLPIEDSLEMNEVLSRVIQKLSRSAFYPNDFKAAFGDATITSERIALALEQFMNTMISGNSKFDQYLLGQTQLTPSELRGLELFNGEVNPGSAQKGADCFHCHGTSLFTNNQFINNGLDSVLTDLGRGAVTGISFDNGKFKVPSLRNIAQTAPYMHDGRFATLDDVLEFYNTGVIHDSPNIDPNMHGFEGGLGLTSAELADLKAFLLTLTDQEFLNKEEFKSPF